MSKKEEVYCCSSKPESPCCICVFLNFFWNHWVQIREKIWKENIPPGEEEIWTVSHVTEHTYQPVKLCDNDCAVTEEHFCTCILNLTLIGKARGNMYVWDCFMANLHYFLDWLIGWLTTEICLLPLKRFSAIRLSVGRRLFFSKSSHLQQSGKEKQP